MSWWQDDYEMGDYPKGSYSSRLDWLSDDNFVGMPTIGKTTPKKKKKKKEPAPQPKAQAEPQKTSYTPTSSPVTRAENQPKPTPAPPAAAAPAPEPPPPPQPVIYNQPSAVKNNTLKINSSYKKPNNRGGTSSFKRGAMNGVMNAAMRINNSLAI